MTSQSQNKKHETYPWEKIEQRFHEEGLPCDVNSFVRENGVPDHMLAQVCLHLRSIRFDNEYGEIETKNGIDQFEYFG